MEVPNQIKTEILTPNLVALLSNLLSCFQTISHKLHQNQFSSEIAGTENSFGDNQLKVDLAIDKIIFDCLIDTKLVTYGTSEETPILTPCNGTDFVVAFDPLDGSSIMEVNYSVGTIMGIWLGDTLVGRTGREQVASLVVMYGPRTTIALAINGDHPKCFELTLGVNQWELTKTLRISEDAKTFAPGNLRATNENVNYQKLINHYIASNYALRYTGGMVPDIYHILIKSQGVFMNVSSNSHKAKLRLVFECAPIALIIEAAGGLSCPSPNENQADTFKGSVLDVVIEDLDNRIGICLGSKNEVLKFMKYML
ncbi:fructose-1,6-bisphosphatase class 1/Sedoheputulose-1,7-bisphosphatase [Globomyces pollinis-pini]|nr:fructose-1,6-bisphosphatase class 1/Sedoheputulose-1,7-bisphosphatase [Globomyces pollinis-pini]